MAAYDPSGLPDMSEAQPAQNGEYNYSAEDAGDDDEDYDPSSFDFGNSTKDATADNMQVDSQPAASQPEPASKPKTKGGFIIEESDDDEEEEDEDTHTAPPPSQANGTEGTQSGLGAVAVSEQADAQDVPLASEPTQDSAAAQNASAQQTAASLNGSAATSTPIIDTASAVPAFDASSSAVSQPAAAASLPTAQREEGKQDIISPAAAGTAGPTSVSATPKPSVNGVTVPPDTNSTSNAVPQTPTSARLPFDKVGRLEDRIKDDPKADAEAWWELIQHYRDKDQLDNARAVFQRMLEVWPTSVRTLPPISLRPSPIFFCDCDNADMLTDPL